MRRWVLVILWVGGRLAWFEAIKSMSVRLRGSGQIPHLMYPSLRVIIGIWCWYFFIIFERLWYRCILRIRTPMNGYELVMAPGEGHRNMRGEMEMDLVEGVGSLTTTMSFGSCIFDRWLDVWPLERGINWSMKSCWNWNTDGLMMLSLDGRG